MFEYCEFNPFTLTGRPSNHFNGINYAALNKEDGSRKRFISRHQNGLLLEIDLSGFHLYLIYLILNEPFPENIYENLSKYYPPNVDAKSYTFKQIYGGVDESLREIEPFKSIIQLQRKVFVDYKTNNLKTFLFDRPINTNVLKGLTQTKLFNYLLQNLETEFNGIFISKLNQLFQDTETKLILYTYDSFLIDYSLKETHLLKSILDVFSGINFHLKVGKNYQDMVEKKLENN